MCVALKIYSARFPQTSVYTQNPPCHTVTQAVLLNLKNPFSHTLKSTLRTQQDDTPPPDVPTSTQQADITPLPYTYSQTSLIRAPWD